MKDRIADDRDNIRGEINFNARHARQFEYAVKIIEKNDKSQLDTLGRITVNLVNYSDFDGQGNIYETIVNSGEIKLLNNDAIVKGIRELEEKYMYINRMENIHYDVMTAFVAPSIGNYLRFSSGQIQEPDSLYSFRFQNYIVLLLRIMDEKEQAYQSTLDEIDAITTLINDELASDQ